MKKYIHSALAISTLLYMSNVLANNTALCFYNNTGRVLQVNYPTYSTGAGANAEAYLKLFPNQTANVSFRIKAEGMIPEGRVVFIHAAPPDGPIKLSDNMNVGFTYVYLYVDSGEGVSASLKYNIAYNKIARTDFQTHCPELKTESPSWWPTNW